MSGVARSAAKAWKPYDFFRDEVEDFDDEDDMGDVGAAAPIVYRPESVTARQIEEALDWMFDPRNMQGDHEVRQLCFEKALHYLDETLHLGDVDPQEIQGFLDLCDVGFPRVEEAGERIYDWGGFAGRTRF